MAAPESYRPGAPSTSAPTRRSTKTNITAGTRATLPRLGPRHRCLRATFSARFNPALPAFSRTPFVAKDIATEDSACARWR